VFVFILLLSAVQEQTLGFCSEINKGWFFAEKPSFFCGFRGIASVPLPELLKAYDLNNFIKARLMFLSEK